MTIPQHRQALIDTYRQQSAEDATHWENRLQDLREASVKLTGIIRRHHAYTVDLCAVYNTFHPFAKIDANALFDDEDADYIGSVQRRMLHSENTLEKRVRIACVRLWMLAGYQRDVKARTEQAIRLRDGADSRLALFSEWEEGRR